MLLGGIDKRFASYGRDYPVERAMFKLTCDRGLATYNTFGISGTFTHGAIDAPVLAFKRMLNGMVEEFIGTHVLPGTRPARPRSGSAEVGSQAVAIIRWRLAAERAACAAERRTCLRILRRGP